MFFQHSGKMPSVFQRLTGALAGGGQGSVGCIPDDQDIVPMPMGQGIEVMDENAIERCFVARLQHIPDRAGPVPKTLVHLIVPDGQRPRPVDRGAPRGCPETQAITNRDDAETFSRPAEIVNGGIDDATSRLADADNVDEILIAGEHVFCMDRLTHRRVHAAICADDEIILRPEPLDILRGNCVIELDVDAQCM
nr:hypothetical protein [Nitratireductor sp. OM-1]